MKTKIKGYIPLAERNIAQSDRQLLADFESKWAIQKKLSNTGFNWITANSVKLKAEYFYIRTSNIRKGFFIILYVKDIEIANVELKNISSVLADREI